MLKHIATYGFHFLEMYLHVQKLHSIIAPSHLSVFAVLLTARRNWFRAVMDTEEGALWCDGHRGVDNNHCVFQTFFLNQKKTFHNIFLIMVFSRFNFICSMIHVITLFYEEVQGFQETMWLKTFFVTILLRGVLDTLKFRLRGVINTAESVIVFYIILLLLLYNYRNIKLYFI